MQFLSTPMQVFKSRFSCEKSRGQVPKILPFATGSWCHLSKQKRTHAQHTHINFVTEWKFECTHTRQGYDARSDVTFSASDRPSALIKCRRFHFCFPHVDASEREPRTRLIKRKVRFHIYNAQSNFHEDVPLTCGRKRQLRKMLLMCLTRTRNKTTHFGERFYTYTCIWKKLPNIIWVPLVFCFCD
jgi:hypothetical protein